MNKQFLCFIFLCQSSLLSIANVSNANEVSIESSLVCSSDDICTFIRPLSADNGSMEQFPYRFKYRKAKENAPTAVLVPGGPGDILSQYDVNNIKDIPQDYGVILIDPRFTGINSHPQSLNFTRAITSKGVAEDILMTLKVLNVRDYILYGISYGTVPATIASALAIENPPRALILDGTVGRALKQAEYVKEFSKQWSQFVQTLSPNLFHQFKEKVKNIIKQNIFTADQMGDIISAFILQRYSEKGEDQLLELISFVSIGDEESIRFYMQYFINLLEEMKKNPDSQLFHSIILCRELSPDTHPDSSDFAFNGERNELQEGGRANCSQYIKPKDIQLFDSKLFQVHAPIIYLQGGNDPATPVKQGLYHFKNQIAPKGKYFVYQTKGGHELLSGELKKCNINFWDRLKEDNIENSVREFIPCGATINPNFIQ